jgi:hypothetical protein
MPDNDYRFGPATISRYNTYDIFFPNEGAQDMTSWKLFEIECPDGRVIRHRHASLEEAKKALQDGYKVCGEVLGASTDDKGGLVMPIGPGTTSVMQTLLEAHGNELLDWLSEHGIEQATVEDLAWKRRMQE